MPQRAAPAFAFWLVLVSIVLAALTLLSTMLMFGESLLKDGALVIAAFTVVGTLIGTYFRHLLRLQGRPRRHPAHDLLRAPL